MSQAGGLSRELLDQVFPFHLVLGPDLVILRVGPSLGRRHPDVAPVDCSTAWSRSSVRRTHGRADGTFFDSESISAPVLNDGEVIGSVVVSVTSPGAARWTG